MLAATASEGGRAISTRPAPAMPSAAAHAEVALRSFGQPNAVVRQFDFWDTSYEWRRLFSELFGTFLLVTVAVGGGMVNARFGGNAVPGPARAAELSGPGWDVASDWSAGRPVLDRR